MPPKGAPRVQQGAGVGRSSRAPSVSPAPKRAPAGRTSLVNGKPAAPSNAPAPAATTAVKSRAPPAKVAAKKAPAAGVPRKSVAGAAPAKQPPHKTAGTKTISNSTKTSPVAPSPVQQKSPPETDGAATGADVLDAVAPMLPASDSPVPSSSADATTASAGAATSAAAKPLEGSSMDEETFNSPVTAKAVLRIQCAFRSRRAKRAASSRRVEKHEQDKMLFVTGGIRDMAILVIQEWWRAVLFRRNKARENETAAAAESATVGAKSEDTKHASSETAAALAEDSALLSTAKPIPTTLKADTKLPTQLSTSGVQSGTGSDSKNVESNSSNRNTVNPLGMDPSMMYSQYTAASAEFFALVLADNNHSALNKAFSVCSQSYIGGGSAVFSIGGSALNVFAGMSNANAAALAGPLLSPGVSESFQTVSPTPKGFGPGPNGQHLQHSQSHSNNMPQMHTLRPGDNHHGSGSTQHHSTNSRESVDVAISQSLSARQTKSVDLSTLQSFGNRRTSDGSVSAGKLQPTADDFKAAFEAEPSLLHFVASIVIQTRWRGVAARKRVNRIREQQAKGQHSLEEKKASHGAEKENEHIQRTASAASTLAPPPSCNYFGELGGSEPTTESSGRVLPLGYDYAAAFDEDDAATARAARDAQRKEDAKKIVVTDQGVQLPLGLVFRLQSFARKVQAKREIARRRERRSTEFQEEVEMSRACVAAILIQAVHRRRAAKREATARRAVSAPPCKHSVVNQSHCQSNESAATTAAVAVDPPRSAEIGGRSKDLQHSGEVSERVNGESSNDVGVPLSLAGSVGAMRPKQTKAGLVPEKLKETATQRRLESQSQSDFSPSRLTDSDAGKMNDDNGHRPLHHTTSHEVVSTTPTAAPSPLALSDKAKERQRQLQERQQNAGDNAQNLQRLHHGGELSMRSPAIAPGFVPPAPTAGAGLSSVFFATGAALLDANTAGRQVFWGVRLLHTVAMDMVLDVPERMPKLELSRWVQGPLTAVLPRTVAALANRRAVARTATLGSVGVGAGALRAAKSLPPQSHTAIGAGGAKGLVGNRGRPLPSLLHGPAGSPLRSGVSTDMSGVGVGGAGVGGASKHSVPGVSKSFDLNRRSRPRGLARGLARDVGQSYDAEANGGGIGGLSKQTGLSQSGVISPTRRPAESDPRFNVVGAAAGVAASVDLSERPKLAPLRAPLRERPGVGAAGAGTGAGAGVGGRGLGRQPLKPL